MGAHIFYQLWKISLGKKIKSVCPYVLLGVFSLSFFGCAKVKYLNEALTLKAYSDEKDAQAQQVSGQDKKFEELLALARSGGLPGQYRRKADLVAAFGEPVLREQVTSSGSSGERFLYRYRARYFDSPKVYVVFDDKDILSQVNVVEPDPSGAGH